MYIIFLQEAEKKDMLNQFTECYHILLFKGVDQVYLDLIS